MREYNVLNISDYEDGKLIPSNIPVPITNITGKQEIELF
jgi:hypothetical protein